MSSKSQAFSRRQFLAGTSLSAAAAFTARVPFLHTSRVASISDTSKVISTLTGDIPIGDLGVTLMHEHMLFFNGATPTDPGYQPIPDNLRAESVNYVVDRLKDAARVGIDTLVDVGPFRPIDLYAEIAARSPVKIIASTGFYRESKRPPSLANMNDQGAMVDYMLKEVQEGIGNTKLRAGIIKVAENGSTLSDWEKKVFTAAAMVQQKTDIHIATHTGNAVEQYDILMKAGADPRRIYFSHVDVHRDGKVGDLIKLLKGGSYLEVDTFGQPFYTPETTLVNFIRSVCDAGYANKLFLSIDSNWHWVNGEKKYEGSEVPHLDANASKRTFSYMVTDVIPMLFKSGFGINDIRTFLVDNPRNYFSTYA